MLYDAVMIAEVKTLIKPCKGLKLVSGDGIEKGFMVKTLIKPCKGLKRWWRRIPGNQFAGENANKTLQGIKT